jgi:hypothetical protein
VTPKQRRGTVRQGDFYPGRVNSKVVEVSPRLVRDSSDRTSFRRSSMCELLPLTNCKEVPINPIIKPRTRYYSSRQPDMRQYSNKKFWEELIAYVPLIRHEPYRKRRVKQFFYCCVCIRCGGNFIPSRCVATIGGIRIQTHRLMRGIYKQAA